MFLKDTKSPPASAGGDGNRCVGSMGLRYFRSGIRGLGPDFLKAAGGKSVWEWGRSWVRAVARSALIKSSGVYGGFAFPPEAELAWMPEERIPEPVSARKRRSVSGNRPFPFG